MMITLYSFNSFFPSIFIWFESLVCGKLMPEILCLVLNDLESSHAGGVPGTRNLDLIRVPCKWLNIEALPYGMSATLGRFEAVGSHSSALKIYKSFNQ